MTRNDKFNRLLSPITATGDGRLGAAAGSTATTLPRDSPSPRPITANGHGRLEEAAPSAKLGSTASTCPTSARLSSPPNCSDRRQLSSEIIQYYARIRLKGE
ncbi:hypothetical protein ACQJBY_012483 [Aegilops geniculata]